jgi:hypothetical protein
LHDEQNLGDTVEEKEEEGGCGGRRDCTLNNRMSRTPIEGSPVSDLGVLRPGEAHGAGFISMLNIKMSRLITVGALVCLAAGLPCLPRAGAHVTPVGGGRRLAVTVTS